MKTILAAALALTLLMPAAHAKDAKEPDAAALYAQHCAECHGAGRLGGTGPALLPENLRRLRKSRAADVIAKGRVSTQMPAFGDTLSEAEIAALVKYIYTPLPSMPVWGEKEIRASRHIPVDVDYSVTRPQFNADPLNLFVVVESGDHHVSILDGDTFERLARFRSRYALHGGPKFTPDGRYVFFASRDGWVTKYDLYTLDVVAEVRAGINTRNIAISHDGSVIAVANYLPHTLVLLDARDLSLKHIIPVRAANGETSRVSAVYQARPRKSLVVALKDVPEVWEIPDPDAEQPTIRRIAVPEPVDDFFFDPSYDHLLGAARGAHKGALVLNMNTGKVVAHIPLPGLPHLGSGITWTWQGRPVMATPHLGEGRISIIAMDTWEVIKTLKTPGPGFFLRSHEKTPYAWADVFFGPNKDKMLVIDKRTLKIVKVLNYAPGKTVAHVEFDRHGKYALISVWEMDGAVLVVDANTFKVVKRIPMKKPVGKYNVYNKITFSEGTSH
ncbi:nitrite reductase [Thermopetrobacter sp. TC1]|uniref:cytochrome D1 domain-containing protein n=1 Tax=Thermopetrobacter sp. TC1 TaxID=1495045 RepID=UPI00057030BF